MARAWHRSLYWRIALGFILFLGTLLVIQAALFVVLLTAVGQRAGPLARRVRGARRRRRRRGVVARPDAGSRGLSSRALRSDVPQHLHRERRRHDCLDQRRGATPLCRAGCARRAFARSRSSASIRPARCAAGDSWDSRPWSTGERVVGMVVVLSDRAWLTLLREFGPILLVISIALLLAGTVAASYLIFGPPHRRLQALEQAVGRFGSGNVAARAPEAGGDEIALVARAFNRMACRLDGASGRAPGGRSRRAPAPGRCLARADDSAHRHTRLRRDADDAAARAR